MVGSREEKGGLRGLIIREPGRTAWEKGPVSWDSVFVYRAFSFYRYTVLEKKSVPFPNHEVVGSAHNIWVDA